MEDARARARILFQGRVRDGNRSVFHTLFVMRTSSLCVSLNRTNGIETGLWGKTEDAVRSAPDQAEKRRQKSCGPSDYFITSSGTLLNWKPGTLIAGRADGKRKAIVALVLATKYRFRDVFMDSSILWRCN